jgi:hypothetical protein
MSGGGLFRIDTNQAKLVGILIEWRDHKKVMVATHIAFCLALIRSQYADLADAIPASRSPLFNRTPSACKVAIILWCSLETYAACDFPADLSHSIPTITSLN